MKKKLIALGIDFDWSEIEPILKSHGYKSKSKSLHSKPRTWKQAAELFQDTSADIGIVIARFTEFTLFLCILPQYVQVRKLLLEEFARRPHAIFIYHENIFGNFSAVQTEAPARPYESGGITIQDNELGQDHVVDGQHNDNVAGPTYLEKWCAQYKSTAEEAIHEMTKLIRLLQSGAWNILPYRTNTELGMAGRAFIENTVRGLIFRIYIPDKRIWSKQFEKVLQLFLDYTNKVRNLEVEMVQETTSSGTTYSFFSRKQLLSASELPSVFQDFTMLLEVCDKNPEVAVSLVSEMGVAQEQAVQIVKRYVTEAKRLLLDIRHEKETKILSIKHRLEAELDDFHLANQLSIDLSTKIPSENIESTFLGPMKTIFPLQIHHAVVNINSQYINEVKGIVAAELSGEGHYSEQDQRLIDLIERFASSKAEAMTLRSTLNELKDKSLPNDRRLTAWQRLTAFLGKVGNKASDLALDIIKAYLEVLMKP